MRESSGRLIIQPDWNVGLREEKKIWISYRKVGLPTVHGEIRKIEGEGMDASYLCSEGFFVEQVEAQRIIVRYMNGEDYCLTTFQAPVTCFTSIHPIKKGVQALDVSNGGLGISSDSQGGLFVWETGSGEIRRKLEGHVGDVYSCKLFPSGVVILSGGSDMMIKIWSAETGQCAATCVGHRGAIMDFAIIDRGRNIFSCSKDGTAKLWDCGTKQCILTLGQLELGVINACSLTEVGNVISLGDIVMNRNERECGTEGKVLALARENGNVSTYSVQSRQQIFRASCHSEVNCCHFIDSTQLVCGTQNGELYFWDIRHTSNPLKVISDRSSAILSLNPAQNGLLVSAADGSCFNLKNNYSLGLEYTGVDCEPVYKVVHDEKFIYTASRDGIIRKYLI